MIASEIRHFYQYKGNLGLFNLYHVLTTLLHSLSIINTFSDKEEKVYPNLIALHLLLI
jgi:hypothetical protein